MKILLSGCSITASPKIVQNGVWIPDGFALGECIDGDVEILSRDGAGNKFITRSGGGIGVTRLIRSMKMEGLI